MLVNRLRTMLAGAHAPALAADAEGDGNADAVGFEWRVLLAFVEVAVTVGLAVGLAAGLGELVLAVGYTFGVLLGPGHAGP